MMSERAFLDAADRLDQARLTRSPCLPLRDLLAPADMAGAYFVQAELSRRRETSGAVAVGRKIGLTAPVVQAQLGVDQPDFGVLYADMQRDRHIEAGLLIQPKVEAEVAFVLDADILDPQVDVASVRGHVGGVAAALEIVDSRILDWKITIADTVADNASSGLFVLGETRLSLDDVEPREIEMTMEVDGVPASQGNGAACLGDPLNALVWLARTAIEFGRPLLAGDVVLSGALGPMVSVGPGVSVTAQLGPLGPVTAVFDRVLAARPPVPGA